LGARFAAYQNMIKAVYDREQSLSEQLEFWRSGHRLELQGYAVQTRPPTGVWPDNWTSREFSMEFSAVKPVRGLLLEVSVPHALGSDQVLEIHAGEWSGTEEVPAGDSRTLEIPIDLDTGQSAEVAIRAQVTFAPGDGNRELACRIVSAALQH
jgi:hypothetical protein